MNLKLLDPVFVLLLGAYAAQFSVPPITDSAGF